MSKKFDYDLIIIGAGVGGHGAALHAVKMWSQTAIIEAKDMGGTCVNRGCIPSKALLAASGKVRELSHSEHLQTMGVNVGGVTFDRQVIADHANDLVSKIQSDLTNSLTRLKVDIIRGWGKILAPQKVRVLPTPVKKYLPLKILCYVLVRYLLSLEGSKLTARPFILAIKRLN